MRFLLLILALWLPALASASMTPVPEYQQPVTDLTDTLTPATLLLLTQRIQGLNSQTGHQLAVLIVNTTGDDSIEQYATRVFERWRLGNSQRDDGLLMLVAKEGRRVRIEVGYGLEGAVTDLQASQIIKSQMLPSFRQQNYDYGIQMGVNALAFLLENPAVARSDARRDLPAGSSMATDQVSHPWLGWLSWLLAIIILPYCLFRAREPLEQAFYHSAIIILGALLFNLFGLINLFWLHFVLIFTFSFIVLFSLSSFRAPRDARGRPRKRMSAKASHKAANKAKRRAAIGSGAAAGVFSSADYSSSDSSSDSGGGGDSGGDSGGGGASDNW